MYYGRKKGIIIAVVIIVVLLVLAIAGACLYMFTDLFKSEKTLFWKYMNEGLGSIKFTQNTQLEDIEKMKEQSAYKINGELKLSSTDETTNNTLEKTKLKLNGETDKLNDYSHLNTILEYSNEDIFNLDYVRNENIYALKSDEIVTAYVGVNNENLKVLFQKLGVTNVENIPDRIEAINYLELFKFSEEELQYIKENYMSVIESSIGDDNYSRQTEAVIQKNGVSYNTTSYRLDLTGTQISQLLLDILTTLKEDSITLNLLATKAKIISKQDISIDDVNNFIDSLMENIQEIEFVDTSLVVYSDKGETIATEILVKNVSKITIYEDNNAIQLIVENLMENADYSMINIEVMNSITTIQSSLSTKIDVDEEMQVVLDITNSGSATEGALTTSCNLSITYNDETTEVEYNQELEFVDELEDMKKLDETNCAILNNYSQQDLQTLMQALVNQIVNVFNQKVQKMGIVQVQEPIVQGNTASE